MKQFLLNNFFYLKLNNNKLIIILIKEILNNINLMTAYITYLNLHLINFNISFFSRKKRYFWLKGRNSNNMQFFKKIFMDCDMDCLIIKIFQINNISCHLNNKNCYIKFKSF